MFDRHARRAITSNWPAYALISLIGTIAISNTIPGLLLRASLAAPLVWTGMITSDQGTNFATNFERTLP